MQEIQELLFKTITTFLVEPGVIICTKNYICRKTKSFFLNQELYLQENQELLFKTITVFVGEPRVIICTKNYVVGEARVKI